MERYDEAERAFEIGVYSWELLLATQRSVGLGWVGRRTSYQLEHCTIC